MRKNNIIKSVSFNITNPQDAKMLKAIKRKRNFSGYVKKLILADIETSSDLDKTSQVEEILPEPFEKQHDTLTVAEKLEQLKRQSRKTGEIASPQVFINRRE